MLTPTTCIAISAPAAITSHDTRPLQNGKMHSTQCPQLQGCKAVCIAVCAATVTIMQQQACSCKLSSRTREVPLPQCPKPHVTGSHTCVHT